MKKSVLWALRGHLEAMATPSCKKNEKQMKLCFFEILQKTGKNGTCMNNKNGKQMENKWKADLDFYFLGCFCLLSINPNHAKKIEFQQKIDF